MKSKPTQAQKDAAQARRDRMNELAKTISAMSPEAREQMAAQSPVVTIEGRVLSPFNQCMLISQRPGVTVVGGFRQWLNSDRCVRKGEKGICLWIPVKGGSKDAEPAEGEAVSEMHFVLGTVFDVTQTDEVQAEQEQAA